MVPLDLAYVSNAYPYMVGGMHAGRIVVLQEHTVMALCHFFLQVKEI